MPDRKDTVTGRTVTFLLPGRGSVPVGGFKVVYEYANGLADRGWNVKVVHTCSIGKEEMDAARASLLRRARRWLGYQRRQITGDYRPDSWFKVNPKVKLLCTPTPDARYMPASEAWVATWWGTANWVATYPGTHLYLIQHLETWCGPESEVLSTWKLPLRKVVISRWLEDLAQSLGELADYIPNGLNFDAFGMDVTPEARDPHTTAMLCHTSDWKGSSDGLKALRQAKSRIPALKAILFGLHPRPTDMPDWVEYHHNPPQRTLRQIYNRAAVFLSPSWAEGWPLPPAEAMQCGSALAATDIGGHREYAIQGQTALLSPAKNPDALAANVLQLMNDQELRIRLARQGHLHIQQFTWDRAVIKFESVLNDALAAGAASEPITTCEPVKVAF